MALGHKKSAVIISLTGGVIVGVVRILQGGHYFSDVVFSAIFVWLTAMIVVYCFSRYDEVFCRKRQSF